MGGYKHNQLKGRSYDEIQKLFDKEMKRAKIAQDSSTKRAGDKLDFDKSKKQKTNENEEVKVDNEAKLKEHMVIVKDDDIEIDAIPLATKPPVIVEYKLIKEGINREDLQTLWKLVKTKHGDTRPEDEHERVLWGTDQGLGSTSAGTPSSTTIDQDAPSLSHSSSSLALQSPSLQQGVAAESTIMEENPFAPVDNDPFVNVFAPKPSSEASSSEDVSSAESTYVTQTHHHLGK
ncbi:hypothetical protein Tco_1252839 [Tanacetum coccineum]